MSDKKVVSIIEKSHDSRMWSAEQMLEDLLEEVRSGKVKPERMIVLFWEPLEDSRLRRSSRAVNFTNAEYAGFLVSASHDALHDWKQS